jgi:DNA-binding SARP family transcriptional activator/predicted ATPase
MASFFTRSATASLRFVPPNSALPLRLPAGHGIGYDPAVIEIRLLGPPEIRRDHAPAALDTRKALAVAARLAMAAGAVSRDALADLLWPEADETRARAVLRRTLTTLRHVVGSDVLVTDRQTVRLEIDRLWIDTVQFDAELAETGDHGHPAMDVCDRCVVALERAVDLYRGDFLEGFSVRDAPDFEAWMTGTASHYRRQAARVLERLAHGHAAKGDYPSAVRAARQWLDLDPIHEPAHRLVMLLHAWRADRGGAIEAYRECVRVLDDELGVSPLDETTSLYEGILTDNLPPPPSTPRPITVRTSAPASPPPPLLVGRDQEWAALASQRERAAVTGQIVAITGESGVGKTRLLEEFATRGSTGVTLVARAYQGERTIPYGVMAQLVEAALASSAAETIGRLPDRVQSIAQRLAPAVDGYGQRSLVEDIRAEHIAERGFVDGLEQLLAACGGSAVAGVLIDDAQWLDNASSTFLAYLLRRVSHHRLIVVLCFRDDELPADSPLALAVADAESAGRLTRIELGPLQVDDVAQLIKRSGSTLNATDVWRRTGGLPLFVVEQLESSTPEDVPDRVRRILTTRLDGLSELARQVLTAASVLDGMIDPVVLGQVAGRSEEEEVEALDELFSKRLLREVLDGTQVEFVQPPMRDAVYSTTSLARRRLLHRRAAATLGTKPRPDVRDAASAARHLRLAGDDEGAAIAYASAGDLAREIYAHAEAAELYRNAIALNHPAPDDLHRSLGDIAVAMGAYAEALHEYEKAAARSTGADAAVADHRLGEVHRRLGHWDAAQEYFTRAEEHHPDQAALHADWSLLERRRGHHERARQHAERARTAAQEHDNRLGLARALDILGILAADPGRAIELLEQSLELAGENPALRMAALNNLSLAVERSGDPDRALALADEALDLARRIGDRHRQAALHNRISDLHHASGDDAASRHALADAVRLFAEIGSEPGTWEPEVWLLTQW